ncbi:MAG: glycoside hydrolase family 32 protein [Eubacteriales bacterium]|nr:glycoside hydrolase family 32 protein [Eubacteriales bacterium]
MEFRRYTIEETRAYEKKASEAIGEKDRPAFHLTPLVGWMNDPNGFSVYQGKTHLFYQYYPYDTCWGPMHWGHAVSEDLIRWEFLPAALSPDSDPDAIGCFSGTAMETEEGHVLLYTGVSKVPNGDGTETELQNQCLAVGDGVNYSKYENNPVVRGEDLPDGFNRTDFRDPKFWKEGDHYCMIAGNRDENRFGQILLFTSTDLRNWKYETVLAHNDGRYGGMWECPDFFALGDKHVLITSPQDMRADRYEFHNGNNAIYFTGDYDAEKHVYSYGDARALDYGFDFYAPETLLLPDGRRVMVGWMQSWDNNFLPQGRKWNGMMTIPRELTLKNGRIWQIPIREIENYRTGKTVYTDVTVAGDCELEGIRGRYLDMTVTVKGGSYDSFTVEIACDEENTTVFTYDPARNMMEADRTYSGLIRDVLCQRKMRVADRNGEIKLRFILDRNSAELFVNDGEQVFSMAMVTPLQSEGIRFSAQGTAVIDVEKYELVMK